MAASNKLCLLARGLSTSASMSQMIRAPVQTFGVEGRYAAALYSAATKMKQLDLVERDLLQVQVALVKSPKLRDTISSPIINNKVLAKTLKDTGAQIGFQAATVNLLQTMADHGRLKKLDSVIKSFKTIMAAHRGEVVCEVTTAKPLDSAQLKQLEGSLRKFVADKETIQLTANVDPSIIGGMIVSIGDKYVDMSIASKVKKYRALIETSA